MHGEVVAVSCNDGHTFSKTNRDRIRLLAGHGVEGDAHAGATVQHRSRVTRDPTQPNLRQVHLLHAELLDELAAAGFSARPGELGENVTIRGIDLLDLPTGTRLKLGNSAMVQITGLRNPCVQLDLFQPGLMSAVLARDEDGNLVRKAGVMAIVVASGEVSASNQVEVELPPHPRRSLTPV